MLKTVSEESKPTSTHLLLFCLLQVSNAEALNLRLESVPDLGCVPGITTKTK